MKIIQRKNLPFELTDQINRIIEIIIRNKEDYPSADVFTIKQYEIEDHTILEDINERTENNLEKFWNYLKAIKAVTQVEFPESTAGSFVLAKGVTTTKLNTKTDKSKTPIELKILPINAQFYNGPPDNPKSSQESSAESLLIEYKEEIIVYNPDIEKLKTLLQIAPPITSQSVESKSKDKLYFYEQTGDIEYLGKRAITKAGRKDYALLKLFSENKNMAFDIEEIKKYANHLIENEAHRFRKEKDVNDTLRQIKFKIKFQNGSYFPIVKRGGKNQRKWLWIEE